MRLAIDLAAQFPTVQRLVSFNRVDALGEFFYKNPSHTEQCVEGFPSSIQMALDATYLDIAKILTEFMQFDPSLGLLERYIESENSSSLEFLLEHTLLTPAITHLHLWATTNFENIQNLDLLCNRLGPRTVWCLQDGETCLHAAIAAGNTNAVIHILENYETVSKFKSKTRFLFFFIF